MPSVLSCDVSLQALECLMISGRGPVSPVANGGPGTCVKLRGLYPQSRALKECLDSDSLCVLLRTFSLNVHMIQ